MVHSACLLALLAWFDAWQSCTPPSSPPACILNPVSPGLNLDPLNDLFAPDDAEPLNWGTASIYHLAPVRQPRSALLYSIYIE